MGSSFLPTFALASVLILFFVDLLSSISFSHFFSVNGEVVYTCGFLIVFYIIWIESFQALESITSTFTFSNLAFFWLQYKKIEAILFQLIISKLQVTETILKIFLLSSLTLSVLNNLKINNFLFKLSISSLNKIRLKLKSLPLQQS